MMYLLLAACVFNLGLTLYSIRKSRIVAQEEVQNYRKFLIQMNPKTVKNGRYRY